MPSWEEQKKEFLKSAAEYHKFIVDGFEQRVESPIESIVMLAIYHLNQDFGYRNVNVHSQKQILNYRVDFLIEHAPFSLKYEPVVRAVIECDGHEFHEKTKEQVSKDKKRDRDLQKLGYTVLRYSGSDLYKHGYRLVLDDLTDLFDPEMAAEMRNMSL